MTLSEPGTSAGIMGIVGDDRRTTRRYPMRLEMQYAFMRPEGNVEFGSGTTVDISSRGVSFRSAEALPVGAPVQLSIHWPIQVRKVQRVKLRVFGKVVRSDRECSAIQASRYEFETLESTTLISDIPDVFTFSKSARKKN